MTATADGFYPSVTPEFTREAEAWAPGKKCPKICPRGLRLLLPGDLVLPQVPNRGPWHKEV